MLCSLLPAAVGTCLRRIVEQQEANAAGYDDDGDTARKFKEINSAICGLWALQLAAASCAAVTKLAPVNVMVLLT